VTWYERAWLAGEPVLPLLPVKARRDIAALAAQGPPKPQILDVGGRKSPYTIGLDAEITVLDLPRRSGRQQQLNLGLSRDGVEQIRRRRSNIRRVVFEDMTRCSLPSESFDGVIAVEVIEHIREDEEFVRHMARVLKPGGWAYLTTPNGDYIPNQGPGANPDHVRHYTRAQLHELLSRHLARVAVAWGVKTGGHRLRGLRKIRPGQPLAALSTMAANVVNHWQSRGLEEQPRRTAHLVAVARRRSA